MTSYTMQCLFKDKQPWAEMADGRAGETECWTCINLRIPQCPLSAAKLVED